MNRLTFDQIKEEIAFHIQIYRDESDKYRRRHRVSKALFNEYCAKGLQLILDALKILDHRSKEEIESLKIFLMMLEKDHKQESEKTHFDSERNHVHKGIADGLREGLSLLNELEEEE